LEVRTCLQRGITIVGLCRNPGENSLALFCKDAIGPLEVPHRAQAIENKIKKRRRLRTPAGNFRALGIGMPDQGPSRQRSTPPLERSTKFDYAFPGWDLFLFAEQERCRDNQSRLFVKRFDREGNGEVRTRTSCRI
jgi:hypothetical protein